LQPSKSLARTGKRAAKRGGLSLNALRAVGLNALRAVGCVPTGMHHGQAKLEGFLTWNAFKPRYAPLEAARQFLLRSTNLSTAFA